MIDARFRTGDQELIEGSMPIQAGPGTTSNAPEETNGSVTAAPEQTAETPNRDRRSSRARNGHSGPTEMNTEPLAKTLFLDGSWSLCRRDASTTKGWDPL